MTKHICEGAKGNAPLGVTWKCLITCALLHFLLSAFVGLSVFLLTSTILSHVTYSGSEVMKLSVSTINISSFLVSLPCAALAHILEDWYWCKF